MQRADLIGTWRLVSCAVIDGSHVVAQPFGDAPTGILVYAPDGGMCVAITRAGRVRCQANDILAATTEEKVAMVDGYLSYAGRFEVVGTRVRHHVEVSLFPNWIDTAQDRNVRLDGDTLELTTDPVVLGSRVRVATMSWRRQS